MSSQVSSGPNFTVSTLTWIEWQAIPKRGTHYNKPLETWVQETFRQQNPSKENIESHKSEYEKFRTYLATKGDYTPSRAFIDAVYTSITSYNFDINQLQYVESLIYWGKMVL